MDDAMRNRIQRVLDGVKDPVSCLPVVELDMIERVRFHKDRGELEVVTTFPVEGKRCMNCVGINTVMIDGIRRNLKRDFQNAFPELKITIS